jgi:hypothetical protein
MESTSRANLFNLPAELRLEIMSYVYIQEPNTVYKLYSIPRPPRTGLFLNKLYSSASALALLLVCKQFRHDFSRLAFNNTHFVLTDKHASISKQMATLQPYQINALRHFHFVIADQSNFRDLVHWTNYPFNNPDLHLDTLAVVFQRNDHQHFPHEFMKETVSLLRRLENVTNLRFIRNSANMKGFFRTWFNRLIGLVLKEDHFNRYDHSNAPQLPKFWWDWNFSIKEQSFELKAREPMKIIDEEEYMKLVAPLIDQLMKDMQIEDEGLSP